MLVVKNLPVNAGDVRDTGSIPILGRSPGKGNGNPLQYFCLENPIDRRAWQATVHGVTKSWTWLKWLRMHACNILVLHRKIDLYVLEYKWHPVWILCNNSWANCHMFPYLQCMQVPTDSDSHQYFIVDCSNTVNCWNFSHSSSYMNSDVASSFKFVFP